MSTAANNSSLPTYPAKDSSDPSQCIFWLRYQDGGNHSSTRDVDGRSPPLCVTTMLALSCTWLLCCLVVFTALLAYKTARYLHRRSQGEYSDVLHYISSASIFQVLNAVLLTVLISCKILGLQMMSTDTKEPDAAKLVAVSLLGFRDNPTVLKYLMFCIIGLQSLLMIWLLAKVSSAVCKVHATGEQRDRAKAISAVAALGLMAVPAILPQLFLVWMSAKGGSLLIYLLVNPTDSVPEFTHYIPLICMCFTAFLPCRYDRLIVVEEATKSLHDKKTKVSPTDKYYAITWPKGSLFVAFLYGLLWQITYGSFKNMEALSSEHHPMDNERLMLYSVNGGPCALLLLCAGSCLWEALITLLFYVEFNLHKPAACKLPIQLASDGDDDDVELMLPELDVPNSEGKDLPLLKA